MNVWPLRFRSMGDGRLFFADDAGGYFISDEAFLDRYVSETLTGADHAFLYRGGHAYQKEGDTAYTGFAWRWTARQHARERLSYVILVPTLRCNLACTYCQVSRAAEAARGFDWTEGMLGDVLRFLGDIETENIKVEFQGGEPLLRVDLLEQVRAFCRAEFPKSEFVVCTNLQRLGPNEIAFLDAEDTFVSTSLDGRLVDHNRHRTQDMRTAEQFFVNLSTAIERFGVARVSALPTVDFDNPPDFEKLIDTYESFGLSSIYLRPVNYQGFARRRAPRSEDLDAWNRLYGAFIDRLIDRNFRTGWVMEEFYFSQCIRRFLRAGEDGHVDLRNPGLPATDYIVVDFDGRLYPSDEARMLARIGYIDLSIGTASSGVDPGKVNSLIPAALNNFDPDCIHCPYQPYCGSDPVDEIARYGRIDTPRPNTWFCQRQLFVFDRIAKLLYSRDEKELFSLRHWAGLASWPDTLASRHHDPATHPS
jgi:His-Xaa-Ser system radical SAM maturase HxsB